VVRPAASTGARALRRVRLNARPVGAGIPVTGPRGPRPGPGSGSGSDRTLGTLIAMAWLASRDDLPCRPARILLAGTSGSGKSTLARSIAAALHIPYTELDALHHGANWAPRAEFVDDVQRLAASERWVTEWQYPAARPLLADRADLLILLDLPRWLVMTRIIRRTLSRRVRRTVLWNGNIEPPLHTVLHNREHIIRWAWRTHGEHVPRVAELIQRVPSLPVVRLSTAAEVDRWLTGPLARAARAPLCEDESAAYRRPATGS
jgi:adenylate kinase family enzyme